jgi:hypothetical protein
MPRRFTAENSPIELPIIYIPLRRTLDIEAVEMFGRFLIRILKIIFLGTCFLLVACNPQLAPPIANSPVFPQVTSTPNSHGDNTATPEDSEPPKKALGPLFVNPDNPRYFTDGTIVNGKSKVVYLTGSHTWCDFMDCGPLNPPPLFDYVAFLNILQENHLNVFRLWRAENARGGEHGNDFWFTPMPYVRSATECCAFDNGNKFDLDHFNQEYFARMRLRISQAGERGIYVSIMLFDGWSVESKAASHDPWKGHPYKLENNINGVDGDVNDDGQGGETHSLANPSITALQEAYTRKVIDTVNDLDNVLYEISNESSANSRDWQYHMIKFIKSYELKKAKQHPVGMTVEYPGGDNGDLFASPADWVSPNGDLNDPPVANGLKVILYDTDHLCGLCGDYRWVWKSFTRGENPIFMDPYDEVQGGRGAPAGYDRNNATDLNLRLNLGYARNYADRMSLVTMKPRPDLCSTGYCLANPVAAGAEYLVFLPDVSVVARLLTKLDIYYGLFVNLSTNGKATVDLSGSPVELSVEWFNPSDGAIINKGKVQGGALHTFTAPFPGDAVLYIHRSNP